MIALILLQLAAAMIGHAYGLVYGERWAVIGLPFHIFATFAWVFASQGDRAARFKAETALVCEHLLKQAELSDPDAYHRDVVAVAYGEMDEADFERKWGGHVPPSPRQKIDPKVALFKELMAADIAKELERPVEKETWTCKVTLGLHDDGPCQCIALEYGPAPRFRVGQFVRFLDAIWRVTDRTPCIGPDVKWWAYYVEQGDALTVRDVRHPDEKQLTLALPHVGEVWEKRECAKHQDPLPGFSRRVRVCQEHPVDWFLHLDRAVECECGCLMPVNFGKGNEAQSFDPTKAKKVPHTGITYVMGTPRKSEKS